VKQLDESLVRKVSLLARTEWTALAALFGGVVAQEIVKQTGKYTPMGQWMHFDAFEMVPNDEKGQLVLPKDNKPVGSRYDHQISIFGQANQDKIGKLKLFLVGCGALGCEYLKAIAMTGMGCDEKAGGEVHITDMDTIELSNLSRQFLFRRKHVGALKSASAAGAATEMNPQLGRVIRVHKIRVEPATENLFNDQFWKRTDFVLNALDNMMARNYTDSKCVLHEKPLFESGTLGTQANTAIVIPHLTPSYAEGAQAGENQGIAKCTLQNFPALPVHCIEWGREMFDENFIDGAQKTVSYLKDVKKWLIKNGADENEELDGLRTVRRYLKLADGPTLEMCVELAFNDFTRRFRDAINDLTHAFPEDARNKDSKTQADLGPFWHGHKRFPRAAEFDVKVPEHLNYVFHGANLYAFIFGLGECFDPKVIADIAQKLKAPKWSPSKKTIKLEEDKKEEKTNEISEADEKEKEELRNFLSTLEISKYKDKITAVEFEKDVDENHHIDWITAATNMRSWNYYIEPSLKSTVRMTAGKIIPAIATTTATITGFVQIEIFKQVFGLKHEAHRGVTLDLGTNAFRCELLPDPIVKKDFKEKVEKGEDEMQRKIIETQQWRSFPQKGVSVWDKMVINRGDLSWAELVKEIETTYPVKVEALFKKGVTDKDIKEGRGSNLFSAKNPLQGQKDQQTKMAASAPNNKGLQAALASTLQKYEAAEKIKESKVSEKYIEVYGKLVTPERNYVLLDGSYTVKGNENERALIPYILFVFKKGSYE